MRKTIRNITLIIDLAILIILLVLNLTAKQVLDEIITESWKSIIPEEVTEKIEEGTNWIQKITGNEKIKEYINEDTINKIKEGLEENVIKEETKKESTSKWDSIKEEMSGYVEDYLKEQEKKLDPKQQMLLKALRFIMTAKMKYYILIAMGITIILMAINLKSLYKWIKSAAYSMAISGVGLFVICYYAKKAIFSIIPTNTITLRVVQTPAFYLIIAGIIVRFIYGVFEIIKSKNKEEDEEDEVSEVSNEE